MASLASGGALAEGAFRAGPGEPAGGAPVQLGSQLPLDRLLASAQQIGEQMVIAIPALLVVQRDQEQVGAPELLEQFVAVRSTGHRVAQVAAEPVEDGGGQQEILYIRWLAVEHLFDQVT